MKYNININQVKCLEWGLNLQQSALLDLISTSATWAESINEGGEAYYYLSAGKIVNELPIISKNKNTVLKILKALLDKDIVTRVSRDNKSYYKLTQKGVEIFTEGCGKKSRQGVEIFPDNNNTIYNNTNNNISLSKQSSDEQDRTKSPTALNPLPRADGTETANEIYTYYISQTQLESKYRYPARAKKQIAKLLTKGETPELLRSYIDKYFAETDIKYRRTPVKFFNTESKEGACYLDYKEDISSDTVLYPDSVKGLSEEKIKGAINMLGGVNDFKHKYRSEFIELKEADKVEFDRIVEIVNKIKLEELIIND